MTYDRDGFPKLKRITPKTSFADVYITIRTLGFDVGKGPKREIICLSRTTEDAVGLHMEWNSHWLSMDDLPEFLNLEMEEQGYIKKEEL